MNINRRNFILVSAVGFFFFFSYSQLVLLPLFLSDRGADAATIGVLMAAAPLASMLARPFAGPLVARLGGRPVLMASSLLYVLMIPAFQLVSPTNLPLFAFLRILQGLGCSTLEIGLNMVAADCDTGGQHRARSMGRASVFYALGWAISPTLAELIYQRAGFTPLFYVGSAAALLAALCALLMVPRPDCPPASFRMRAAGYNRRIFSPTLLRLLAIGLCVGLVNGALTTFVPLYAQNRGVGAGSLFFLAYCVSTVLVRTPTAGLSDRLGRRILMVPALLIDLASPLALWNLRSAATVGLSGVLFGFGQAMFMPALLAFTLDTQDAEHGPVAMGLVFMAMDGGGMLGSATFGYLTQAIDFGPAFGVLSLCYLIAIGLTLSTREVAQPRRAEA